MSGPTCISGVFEMRLESEVTSKLLAVLSEAVKQLTSSCTFVRLHIGKEVLKINGENV